MLVRLYNIIVSHHTAYIGDKEYMYYVNIHVAEIVGITFASMVP